MTRRLTVMGEPGFFLLLLPRSLGGDELDPVTFTEVIEEVAKADADRGLLDERSEEETNP